MEIIRFAVIDSTSARARELLANGKPAPFAVVAEHQTAGRGRRGHKWESPIGNLYVTFVLPPLAKFASDASLAPLKAAVCCARALRYLLGLRLTLKWPNDLLFAGQKIGGLLCETSLVGQDAGEVLVGLGLNTQCAPALAGVDAPRAGALADFCEPQLDHEQLIHVFWREWQTLALGEVIAAFTEFASGPGQPWVEYGSAQRAVLSSTVSWTEVGLGEAGELVLMPAAPGSQPLRLTSVEHRCTWAYAGHGRDHWPLLVADCGNSRLKLALYAPAASAGPTQIWALPSDVPIDELAGTLAQLAVTVLPPEWPLFVASVNPQAAERLTQAAHRACLRPFMLPKRRLRSFGERYALAPLGIDRLAALEGALARRRGLWQLVISLGTATTIDALRSDGWHAGGWILPGIQTGLSALHQVGRLLPQLQAREGAPLPARLGNDTHSAMISGMVQMTVGAIERACKVLDQEHPGLGRPQLVLTGGDADVVIPHLPEAESVPHLILDGLRAMVLGGF